jgi:predicted Zn-dependent protease
MSQFKPLLKLFTLASLIVLDACSVNPATGEKQFAALMSPQQEVSVGATEHDKIVKQYGLINDPSLTAYVNKVGQRVTRETERSDVQYKFFIIDSPIVNAFALPGGYIYISRGLLALANNEAELAAVLAHETGHITGRHSAERYSTGVVTSLGAGLLSAAIGSTGASKAIGLGSNLYLSSYSRSQETQADSLGLRYMSRGGYDVQAMPSFLYAMQQESALEGRLAGKDTVGASYFSTHPATAERVGQTSGELTQYPKGGDLNRSTYQSAISGIVYGDNAEQGFVRGQSFYHPALGFTFSVPEGFNLVNQPAQIIAMSPTGAVVIFDMAEGAGDPLSYVQGWAKGAEVKDPQRVTVNGMEGATAAFQGSVNGKAMDIRLLAVKWNGQFARFQIAFPQGTPAAAIEDLKRMTYSFRAMTAAEKNSIRPQKLVTFTASSGDTVESRAARLPFDNNKIERFRVLNGLRPNEELQAGQMYKTIEG